MRVAGIDTGGTFTDLIACIDGELVVRKVLSRPDDPGAAVLDALGDLALSRPLVVHGTTVATNALLERRGARVALVTTSGFEDVIELGRQARPDPYALDPRRPEPLVPRSARFGVPGPLDPHEAGDVRAAAGALARLRAELDLTGVEAVAVCLLFSYLDPAAEEAVTAVLDNGPWSVCRSSEVLPVFREYERTSTTVANAYVAPVMGRYLVALRERAPDVRFQVMASNAGSLDLETAARLPASCFLSGPAGGVLGAARVCASLDIDAFMTLDMGGTSTDVCLVEGDIPMSAGAHIDGLPVAFPAVDIHTVGAGGGSIARADSASVLRVGPESAGAMPGPIAYGRGDRPTVTDANVLLGRMPAAVFAHLYEARGEDFDEAGIMARVRDAFVALGDTIGAGADEAALAVLDSIEASMARALRVISTRRGRDPRDFALVCFGGAGGLHGAALARTLGVERVVVPPFAGALSAYGLAGADQKREYLRVVLGDHGEAPGAAMLEAAAGPLVEAARRDAAAIGAVSPVIETRLDVRYCGQSYEIDVPLAGDFRQRFDSEHEVRFGHSDATRAIEVVHVRVRATVPAPPVTLDTGVTAAPGDPRRTATASDAPRAAAIIGGSTGEPRRVDAVLIERATLAPAASVAGPAVILESTATSWVPPGWRASVAASGALVLESSSPGADDA